MLTNPGMGYQGWTQATSLLNQSTEYRRGEHPQQGGFDWETLNPRQGEYDWSPIDQFLADCALTGRQGSFRIYTMNGYPYGTNRVPEWVKAYGGVIRDTAELEPDYRNRSYQQHWGTFVDALAQRYDGDHRIAFIDISGYGLYNEWQANDLTDTTDPDGLGPSIDASARRHLIHMFVGGSGDTRVIESDGVSPGTATYSHVGFQRTQLVMPYGGLWSSSRYVAAHYPTVGFRNDALFSSDAEMQDFLAMGFGISEVWRTAPVIFEAVGPPSPSSIATAATTLRGMGASIVHENAVIQDAQMLSELIRPLGYRYLPLSATTPTIATSGSSLAVSSTWTNTGTARAYPRMGQDFTLAYALASPDGTIATTWQLDYPVSGWLPGEQHDARDVLPLPRLAPGTYTVLLAVASRISGQRISLPLDTHRSDQWYGVATLNISS